MELTEKYRPKKLDRVVGQVDACRMMTAMLDAGRVAKCWLFTGPSGCGKTTLARILKRRLKVDDVDFREINAAESRGIDTVREISAGAKLEPMVSPYRMYLVDECHKLTNDAQNALLKVAEDGGKKGIIVLCTTDPAKLIPTLKTRATEIKVKPFGLTDLEGLLGNINRKEYNGRIHKDVIERITEVCDGSARKAVKILEQVAGLKANDQLDAVQSSDMRTETFDLVKEMIPFRGKPSWGKVAKILEALKGEDIEGIRKLVLAVCASHMLKGNDWMKKQAHRVYGIFQYPFYDTGFPGLVAAAYEVVNG